MKISIVTPSFSQAHFLSRTIESVISQTGDFELEYIIIDGGSSDGSVDIIKQYAQQDSRIQWVSEVDRGQSHAINKGLHKATGDVVAFLNSDDIYYPNTLQTITETFQNNQAVMWAYGKCRIINENDEEIKQAITLYKNVLLRRFRYWKLLIVNYISQPATFWRRNVFHEIGDIKEDEHLAMDYEYWCRLGNKYPAHVIHTYLAGFRYYATSKSGQQYKQQFDEEYVIAKRFTNNWLVLILHKIHATLIQITYSILSR